MFQVLRSSLIALVLLMGTTAALAQPVPGDKGAAKTTSEVPSGTCTNEIAYITQGDVATDIDRGVIWCCVGGTFEKCGTVFGTVADEALCKYDDASSTLECDIDTLAELNTAINSAVVTGVHLTCADLDSADLQCSTETLVFTVDTHSFEECNYQNTIVGIDMAANDDECWFASPGGQGGGFACEGSVVNSNEAFYLFPDDDPADVTRKIVVNANASVDNEIARHHSTSGQFLQGYTSGAPTIGDTGEVIIPLGSLTSTQAATALSWKFNNGTGRTSGDLFEFQDNGSEMFSATFDELTRGGKSSGLQYRDALFGLGYGPGGYSDRLRIGFFKYGVHPVGGNAYYEIMTEAHGGTENYPLKIGVEETVFLELNQANSATLFKKGFNAEAGGIFGGNMGLTDGYFYKPAAGGITAAGSTQGTATQMACQICEVDTVVAGTADGVKTKECDAATGNPTVGTTITVINTSAVVLDLFPATGDNLGAGVNTQVSIAAGTIVDCTCYLTNLWECDVR